MSRSARVRACLAVAASVAVLTIHAAGAARAAVQSIWRGPALASFDDVWQTIHDTFYDPSFGGLDWAGVRAELRPRAEAAASPDDVRHIITDMLSRLGRSHFVLLSSAASGDDGPVMGDAIVPIDIRVVSGAVVITRVDPAAVHDGLRAGDVITAIGDTRVSRWAEQVAAVPSDRARALELWKKATRALYGVNGSRVAITVDRDGSSRSIPAERRAERGEVITLGNLPPLHVRVNARETSTPMHHRAGVIDFNIWLTAIDTPVAAAVDRFRHDDGIVIDLRGNPGGLAGMMRGIAGHFIGESVILGTSRTREASLEFKVNPRVVTPDGRRVAPFAGKVAILVDELTGSTSECFTAALQSLGRARVFGRTSMGEALPASTKRLPDGDVLLYAIGDFVTGNGRSVEGDGVTPDELVPITPASLSTGRDPVLEAALRWIDGR